MSGVNELDASPMDLQEDSVGQRLSFGMIRRQAYEALAANELVRAEELLHLALTADPTQETIQYSVGVLRLKQGRSLDALTQFDNAVFLAGLKKNPKVLLASHVARGTLLEQYGHRREAMASYAEVLKLDPQHEKGNFYMGRCLLNNGLANQALKHLECAARAQTASISRQLLHMTLGTALDACGRHDDAARFFRQAVQESDGAPSLEALVKLGQSLLHRCSWSEAADAFRKALAQSPTNEAARNGLGAALAVQGKLTEAGQTFQALVAPKAPANSQEDADAAGGNVITEDRIFATVNLSVLEQISASSDGKEYNLSQTYARSHELLQTAESSTKKLKLDKKVIDRATSCALCNLGSHRLQNNDTERARSLYKKALMYDPQCVEATFNLGLIHLRHGRFEAAANRFEACVQLSPNRPECHASLGTAYSRMKQTIKAIASYRRACELQPTSFAYKVSLAQEFMRAEEGENAIAVLLSAKGLAETDQEQLALALELASAFVCVGRATDAVMAARKAVQIDPLCSECHFRLGDALQAAGNDEQAIEAYDQCIRLNPEHYAARNNISTLYLSVGKVDMAIKHLKACATSWPQFAHVFCNLGIALAEQQQYAEAIVSLKRCIDLDPSIPQAHYEWGMILFRKAQFEGALRCFRVCVQLNDNEADYALMCGLTCLKLARLGEARLAVRKAIQISGENPDAHAALGHIALVEGNLMEARAHFEQVLALDATHKDARWFFATYNHAPEASDKFFDSCLAVEPFLSAAEFLSK